MADCPVPGCTRPRKASHMMCLADWRRVSTPTQREVYKRWRAVEKARRSHGGGALIAEGEALAAYRKIREQAIREAEA